MNAKDDTYQLHLAILREELLPATGCTEPVAIAYAAAVARSMVKGQAHAVVVQVSGNILKNAKSVIVPGTGGMSGIPAAAAAGIVAGRPQEKLDVINHITGEQTEQIHRFTEQVPIKVESLDTRHVVDIMVSLQAGGETAKVRITDTHTNITLRQLNDEILEQKTHEHTTEGGSFASPLALDRIFDFAQTVAIQDVEEILDKQIACNSAIAKAGMSGAYGAGIGSILCRQGEDAKTQAKAQAAAASDARMGGCDLPVVINSGSGNQGICVSLPVIVYAEKMGFPKERLYRALVLSNLVAIHQKKMIGYLSAYCGAVSAGAAAGAGIAYMMEGSFDAVVHTLVNALAMASGIVCDGAKPSCAAKIAISVEAGLLGYQMYQNGTQFRSGEGIISAGAEATVQNVARMARDGMSATDREIIQIMLQ